MRGEKINSHHAAAWNRERMPKYPSSLFRRSGGRIPRGVAVSGEDIAGRGKSRERNSNQFGAEKLVPLPWEV